MPVRELRDGGQWTYEAKLDGYRCLVAKRYRSTRETANPLFAYQRRNAKLPVAKALARSSDSNFRNGHPMVICGTRALSDYEAIKSHTQ